MFSGLGEGLRGVGEPVCVPAPERMQDVSLLVLTSMLKHRDDGCVSPSLSLNKGDFSKLPFAGVSINQREAQKL